MGKATSPTDGPDDTASVKPGICGAFRRDENGDIFTTRRIEKGEEVEMPLHWYSVWWNKNKRPSGESEETP